MVLRYYEVYYFVKTRLHFRDVVSKICRPINYVW